MADGCRTDRGRMTDGWRTDGGRSLAAAPEGARGGRSTCCRWSTGGGNKGGGGLGLAATAESGKVVDVDSGALVLDVEAGCAYHSPTNSVTLAGSGLFVSARDSYQCIYDSEKNVFCFGLCAMWESAGDWVSNATVRWTKQRY